eukprot:904046-Prorocentrum_lima.AAC.1
MWVLGGRDQLQCCHQCARRVLSGRRRAHYGGGQRNQLQCCHQACKKGAEWTLRWRPTKSASTLPSARARR